MHIVEQLGEGGGGGGGGGDRTGEWNLGGDRHIHMYTTYSMGVRIQTRHPNPADHSDVHTSVRSNVLRQFFDL